MGEKNTEGGFWSRQNKTKSGPFMIGSREVDSVVRSQGAYGYRFFGLMMRRSTSSRLGNVRKISELGKGLCRKNPHRMRWNRLRRKDGRTIRW